MKAKKLAAKRRKAKARNARQAKSKSQPHTCGDCRACCSVFPLGEKPAGQWCQYSTPTGCACYGIRPEVCRSYVCGYLVYKDCPRKWRPDRSGVIISYRGTFQGHRVVVLTNCWPNAVDGLIGRTILECLSRSHVVFYRQDDKVGICGWRCELICDARRRAELIEWMDSSNEAEQARIDAMAFGFAPPGGQPLTPSSPVDGSVGLNQVYGQPA